MNMTISSNSTPVGKSATANASSSAGSASGSGFAGALVQAIDGKGATAHTSGGLALPVGLVGLLGQLGEAAAEPGQDLLAMLAKLIEQLQQLEKDGADSLSPEVQDQLASMLAAFQSLLQQLNPSLIATDTKSGEAVGNVDEPQTSEVQPSGAQKVLGELSKTLQQLSQAISSNKENAPLAASFVTQLQAILDANAVSANSSDPIAKPVSNDDSKSASVKELKDVSNGSAVPKETFGQVASVTQEPRRPIQALRDPVWRFNVDGTSETTDNKQAAIVPAVATAKEANSSDSQPAWTFLQNDALAKTDATSIKAVLPAQVPVQQFAEQMEKFLVKQFQLTQGNGSSEAKLSLTPEHLGQVDIRIVMHNGQLTAQFMTESAMAKDMLENQMAQLKSALSGQGLQVERLEVVQQSSSSAGTSFMNQEQRHSNSGNGQGSNGSGKGDSIEDPAIFAAEMERTSSLKEFGYGSAINVTA